MKPSSLFKYQPLNYQTLKNLKQQTIYFGSPANFNDPYDCALEPQLVPPSSEQLTLIRNHYLSQKGDFPSEARYEIENVDDAILRESVLRSARDMMSKSITDYVATKGVTCFSEKNDDLLMWAHYAGDCRGICLEFDVGASVLEKARPVSYVSEPPTFEIARLILESNYEPFVDLFYTKSDIWRYECEWRATHNVQGTSYTYDATDLSGVYFGPDVDNVDMEIVCLILLGQNPNVPLWQARRMSDQFGIEFQRFNYIPHLIAKQNGLL